MRNSEKHRRLTPAFDRAGLFAVVLVASLLAAGGCARQPVSYVIEPGEVGERLRAVPPPVVLDVRTPAEHAAGHLARAVLVDSDEWKTSSLAPDEGIEQQEIWCGRIGALGVGRASAVLIYDDGRMTEAARIWFLLQSFGVERAAIINGGWKALQPEVAAGTLPISREPVVPAPRAFKPDRASAVVTLASRAATRGHVERRDAQIWDARTVEEYTGVQRHRNPRGGHLPGAVNLPHRELLTEDGRLRPPEELRARLTAAGFDPARPLVTHCESGGRASLAALAALQAGFGTVANYYRSFSDWAADETCPLEPGETPGHSE